MRLKTLYSNFKSKTFEELIKIIDEVGALYDSQGVAFDYDMYHKKVEYCVKFKIYG